jgi:hypothetical protein
MNSKVITKFDFDPQWENGIDNYDFNKFDGFDELKSAFEQAIVSKCCVLKVNSVEIGNELNEPINIYKEQEAFDDVNACNYISVKDYFKCDDIDKPYKNEYVNEKFLPQSCWLSTLIDIYKV